MKKILVLVVTLVFIQACYAYNFVWYKNNVVNNVTVTQADLEEFAKLYEQRPIKDNNGGMKSVSMFWVWFATKVVQPDLIIESGIWYGQSTWLLEQAAPQAKIIAIDPDLSRRKYISENAIYTEKDFSLLDLCDVSNCVALAFFDDHQNAYLRVRQAQEKGIKYLLFDDNYPVNEGSHLSLAHCLNMPKHKEKYDYLNNSMKLYTILPQIVEPQIKMGRGVYPIATLGLASNFFNTLLLNIYKRDANAYRWTTFVQLK